MKFSSLSSRFCNNPLEGYNSGTGVWDTFSFGANLANSGRWIGRSEDFYNRRVLLVPEPIPAGYQVIRLAGAPEEYLVYGNQDTGQVNVFRSERYLYEYNALNVEPSYAELVGLANTVSASGVPGIKVEVSKGFYPVAVDRYASSTNTLVKDIVQSKVNVFIPTYALTLPTDHLVLGDDLYDIKEVYLELGLSHLNCIKR